MLSVLQRVLGSELTISGLYGSCVSGRDPNCMSPSTETLCTDIVFFNGFLVHWYTRSCQEVPLETDNCCKYWLAAERLVVRTTGCHVPCSATKVLRDSAVLATMLSSGVSGTGIECRPLQPLPPPSSLNTAATRTRDLEKCEGQSQQVEFKLSHWLKRQAGKRQL